MAKKKKDPAKKAALQAKKADKADKAARKRLTKETKGEGGDENEDNLDDLLESYRQKDIAVENTVLETLPGFPPPRANATLTLADDKNGFIFLFGGEYYDGVTNIVLNDLFRWDVTKSEWRQVLTPAPKPEPRCAHSTVYYKDSLYVLGGELASAEEYHHYRDLWRFDLPSLKWQELSTRGTTAPSARSGHAAFVWKHYMVVFGGFYEALRDTLWYNDVYVLDLQTLTWMDIPHSKLASRPEPRSACNVGLRENVAIIHGGYSKLKNPGVAEQKVHSDAWLLHLKPILQGNPPTWERLSNRTKGCSNPSNRSGTSSVTYKDRMLVYGGVVDTEQHHHRVDSVFYNELFAFDMERRTWFPLRCKAVRDTKSRRRRRKDDNDNDDKDDEEEEVKEEEEETEDESSELEEEEEGGENPASSGWDLDKLRSNMFAFIDGDGNTVYEKILEETEKDGYEADAGEAEEAEANDSHVEEAKEDDTDEEEEETKGDDSDEEEQEVTRVKATVAINKNTGHAHASAGHVVASSSVMKVNQETGAPEAVAREEPLPRINATVVVRSNILYVYGGILEVGDREVTLDDCWCFDMRKRDKWECLWGGTMHKQVWRGAIHDDDDSYISTDVGGDDDEDDDDDAGDDVGDEVKDEDALRAAKAAKKTAKKEQEKSKRAGLRQEISDLKGKLDLDGNVTRTPQMGEVLAEFYSRTNQYWNDQAAANIAARSSDTEKLSSKELKRQGFKLASERYDELRPVLERLDELELQRAEAEEDKKNRKEKRKGKK
jgi:N-acetylneuraminic acid mutarotase